MVPGAISYERLDNGLYRLNAPMVFFTPVMGYNIMAECWELDPDGKLTAKIGFVWDMASGPALDTPDMVFASVAHDIGCHLTNSRMLDWKCRAMFDRYFRDLLKYYKTGFVRRWYSWLAVSAYSQLIARWRDKQ